MFMKKFFFIVVFVLLLGCSVYNQFVECMQIDMLEYCCDEKLLIVKFNNLCQEVSFVYDNKLLMFKQGIFVFGVCYSDGIYVFWLKGDSVIVYK